MRSWLRSSLQRKLSVLIAGSIIVPLVVLGLFAFDTAARISEEKATLSGIDYLKQLEANLRFMLQDVDNLSIYLIGERDIQDYLVQNEDQEEERQEIIGRMTNLAASKSYIASIVIKPEHFSADLTTANWYEADTPEEQLTPIREKHWSPVYRILNYAGEQHVMTLTRPIRSIHNYKHLGWLSISLSEKDISHRLAEKDFARGSGRIELIDSNGVILSSPDKTQLGIRIEDQYPGLLSMLNQGNNGSVVYGEKQEKRTIMYVREPSTGWTLIGSIPYDLYREENRYILTITAVAVAMSVLISACLAWATVRRITRPLLLLTRHLYRINPHEPLPHFTVTTEDEIGKLGQSYNMLGAHIEQLKQDLIREEARKKEADMHALQAQINPHFLYNTLASIHWISLMAKEKRIADMVEGLSQFLRISLNQGKEYCPVSQEIDHIRQYVRVQNIRYPDKFKIQYMVDPELENKWMLKLLLQPLIENAMIHGLNKKEGPGSILIMVRQEQKRMGFLILDDGAGMSMNRLADVRKMIEAPKHRDESISDRVNEGSYGLRNVNERLLLHYGPDAHLEIDSREGGGTRIAFTIPIMEETI
ncbi:sensor histidine kinase [Paenibacillus provencensis]|uniref:Sensor histidine kinase n=1 Tax=Paenibacillus provencensis TaxID=441151 RepID=A0ABW3PUB1_9BACL|nr:sensor histidine kinase [Paenibacillus sp. MER 78]MCM3129693.1 sensor histidine kinase [Paenibacillus sp. MER 78]